MTACEYEFMSLGEGVDPREDVKLLNREGAEGWELVCVFQKFAIFKRGKPALKVIIQEVKSMNPVRKLEGNRTVIALALFALLATAQLFGITPDSLAPEKQSLIKEILGALAGIFLALKGNRLISKTRG